MKLRTATLAAAVLTLAALVPAMPAQAVTAPTHRTTTYPLCVTTAWRAAQTGQPMTPRGASCQVRAGMWIPSSWHRVGVTYSADGSQAFEVWRRPAAPVLPHLQGYPRCVASTWAVIYYHVAKTPSGTTCFVPMHARTASNGQRYFIVDWYPLAWSWNWRGWINDKNQDPIAMLVEAK